MGSTTQVGRLRDNHCLCQVSQWQGRALEATNAAAEARAHEAASAQQIASLKTKLCEAEALAEVQTFSAPLNTPPHTDQAFA